MGSDSNVERALEFAQRPWTIKGGTLFHDEAQVHILVLLAALYRREAQGLCLGSEKVPVMYDDVALCPVCRRHAGINTAGTVAAHPVKP